MTDDLSARWLESIAVGEKLANDSGPASGAAREPLVRLRLHRVPCASAQDRIYVDALRRRAFRCVAAVGPGRRASERRSGSVTSQAAELEAIVYGLEWARAWQLGNIAVFTDNLSALVHTLRAIDKARNALPIAQKIVRLALRHPGAVELRWISREKNGAAHKEAHRHDTGRALTGYRRFSARHSPLARSSVPMATLGRLLASK